MKVEFSEKIEASSAQLLRAHSDLVTRIQSQMKALEGSVEN